MAVAFTENEKLIIDDKLKKAAEQCLKNFGVKKTTVEQLTKIVGISKGAFYLFYESKELLFFRVLEDFQRTIGEELISILSEKHKSKKQGFIEGIFNMFLEVKDSFFVTLMENQDLEYLMRKLPQEVISNHHSFDDKLAENIFKVLGIEISEKVEIASAALRAIFLTMLHEKEIGVHYEKALKVLIVGVANDIFGEGN
jgi:AcrR family transcriptional regulator